MRKLFMVTLFCLFAYWSSGQNIFPANGNVGIGTNTPEFPLHVLTGNNVNGIILGNFTGAKFFLKIDNTGSGQIFARNGAGQTQIFLSAGAPSFFQGNLGIGVNLGFNNSNNPNGYKLAVNGLIGTKEVQVENTSSTWPDYVFEADYPLPSLDEIENFIRENKHLPGIPSAAEVEKNNGVKLGEMNVKLLEKVEELTLYILQQEKKYQDLLKRVEQLENEKKN